MLAMMPTKSHFRAFLAFPTAGFCMLRRDEREG